VGTDPGSDPDEPAEDRTPVRPLGARDPRAVDPPPRDRHGRGRCGVTELRCAV